MVIRVGVVRQIGESVEIRDERSGEILRTRRVPWALHWPLTVGDRVSYYVAPGASTAMLVDVDSAASSQ